MAGSMCRTRPGSIPARPRTPRKPTRRSARPARPATYASILTVLRDRAYVRMDKNRFIPEDKGRLLTAFLEEFFRRYVEYDFTADLEEKLDLVSAGELDWKALLREFWKDFSGQVGEIADLRIGQVLDALDAALGPHLFPPKADGTDPRGCPTCG